MPILAVVNPGPATGKTTTAVAVAAHLAAFGAATLLVDADPNGDTTAAVGRIMTQDLGHALRGEMRLAECVAASIVPQLDLVRASSGEGAGREESSAQLPPPDLGPLLQEIAGSYSYVVVDCPADSQTTQRVLEVADLAIVPAPAEAESLDDLAAVMAEISQVQRTSNPGLRVYLVITMHRSRGPATEMAERIRKSYPRETLGVTVPFDARLDQVLDGESILNLDAPGRHAYERVAMEIAARSSVPVR